MTPNPYDNAGSNDAEQNDPLLRGLNPSQRLAVQHMEGPLLVLAGPGSGKTRVVTHRIAWLLRNGVHDWNIAALTFTNKAAEEMKSRLQTLAPGNHVWVGTFHRFCAYILRYYAQYVGLQENYVIYDAAQSQKLLEEVVPKSALPNGVDVGKIANAISWAKNNLVAASEYTARPGSLLGRFVETAYPAYQEALRKANAVDFDDLLFHVAVLLKQEPQIRENLDYRFRYVLVDEYQDTNLVQYAIARALSVNYPNLAVTGDPDQSIYGWRGANIQNILNFEEDFENATVIRLEQNYRSVKSILRVADHVIKNNEFRKDKDLYTDNPEGDVPRIIQCLDQNEEADAIAAEIANEIANRKRRPRDYAIFYRMNALSRNLEYALKRYGVPYQLVRGLEFFNRKEIKDVCAYFQLLYNPNDVIAFKRVVNLPARGIGQVSLNRLEIYANELGISLSEATRHATKIPGLSKRVQKALTDFAELLDSLRKSLDAGDDLELVLSLLLDKTQYVNYLRNSQKTEEDEQRLANIQELLSEVKEFDHDYNENFGVTQEFANWNEAAPKTSRLGKFLEQIALVSDVDAWDANDDRVSLMTLHAAKGLEFPVVYVIALEDGVLPHERSTHDKRQLEEERRLLFVGITRAQEELRMSRVRFREFRGSLSATASSRFLFEFPKNGVESYDSVEQWLDNLRERCDSPNDVPILIPREGGVSQRQAIWREQHNAYDLNAFADAHAAPTRRNVKSSINDFIDPEPEDDYSQEPPENKKTIKKRNETQQDFGDSTIRFVAENCDVEASDEVVYYLDEDQAQPRAPKRKRAPISPTALSTGSDLEQKGQSHERDSTPLHVELVKSLRVKSLVRHKRYGVGVVKRIAGPSFDRVVLIEFLSGIGQVELSVKDPDLTLIAPRRNTGN
ncbi:MAG: UvrD-helicase domain-containing protein [Planctomycetia bacterium]|nr:UvrD-helicase domain-containing protein [Planctomycetia bacterium]